MLLKPIIKSYFKETNSLKAEEILSDWNNWKERFKILAPPSEKAKIGLVSNQKLVV